MSSRTLRLSTAAALALALVLGCRSGGGATDAPTGFPCSPPTTKADVKTLTYLWYLWPDLLPAPPPDPASYATPAALLSALTAQARAAGRDRNWSVLITKAEAQAYFAEGQTTGLGLNMQITGNRFFVAEVMAGSPAAGQLARGDEILAVASTLTGLADPANQLPALIANGKLDAVLAKRTAGIPIYLQVRRGADASVVDLALTPGTYTLDPVPGADAPIIIDRLDGHLVGYLRLTTFVETAEPRLRKIMGAFRRAGVTDLVVDLRYNGGGTRSTEVVLCDLLRRTHGPLDVLNEVRGSSSHASEREVIWFSYEPQAMDPGRIAILQDGGTASASEAAANALAPWYGDHLALPSRDGLARA